MNIDATVGNIHMHTKTPKSDYGALCDVNHLYEPEGQVIIYGADKCEYYNLKYYNYFKDTNTLSHDNVCQCCANTQFKIYVDTIDVIIDRKRDYGKHLDAARYFSKVLTADIISYIFDIYDELPPYYD
jgi:hypothetical protein